MVNRMWKLRPEAFPQSAARNLTQSREDAKEREESSGGSRLDYRQQASQQCCSAFALLTCNILFF